MGKVEAVSYSDCNKESENMPRTVRGVHHTTVMDKATSLCSKCQHVCSSLVVLPPYFTLSQNLIKSVTLKVARMVTHVTGVYLQAQSMDDGTLCPEDGQRTVCTDRRADDIIWVKVSLSLRDFRGRGDGRRTRLAVGSACRYISQLRAYPSNGSCYVIA